MNTNGTGVTQITSGPASYAQPAWSPVGNRLLFVDSTNGHIILSTTDGTSQTLVTPTSADYRVPRFSPDGTRVLYTIEGNGTQRKRSITRISTAPAACS